MPDSVATVTIDDSGVKALIRDIPDYPVSGVLFRDITPLLNDAKGFRQTVDTISGWHVDQGITKVIGVEARGFIFAAPVAIRLGAGFVPVRKPDKLPWNRHREGYELEYGVDHLEVHTDALTAGDRVLIVDDVLATGGTAAATARLVGHLGCHVTAFAFVVELAFLNGRALLDEVPTRTLAIYR